MAAFPPYSKQTWDTTSFVNPTRMNHIEEGIYDATSLLNGNDAGVSFTPASGVTINWSRYSRQNNLVILQLVVDIANPTTNETNIGSISGISNIGYTVGNIASLSNTSGVGTFVLSSTNLYIKLTTTSYSRVGMTIICLT